MTDSYKLDHRNQYPQGTEFVYSNFTNRASRNPEITHAVSFGPQIFVETYLMEAFEPFFAATEDEVAEAYTSMMDRFNGPNTIGDDHIRALHRKGYLPLRLKTISEGSLVPMKVPVLTIENTDPEFFWLTNYIETVLSATIWQPSTSATKAVYMRNLIEGWAEKTGANKEFIDWQFHDFSFRGQTSPESAAASGMGHLLAFTGTDNIQSLEWIDAIYPGQNGFIGGSVWATEHSVMCAGGKEDERDTYSRLLDLYPTGIVSIVSDTWDLWNVLTDIIPSLKEKILARDGKTVIRPDSGDPADILCGTARNFGEGTTPAEKGAAELLWEAFGGTVNAKGYKTLDAHIGLIYGDSITPERAIEIFSRLEAKGFASDNIVFGAGSYFYQYNTRDTLGSAMKATWVQINGEGHNIMKDPITGAGKKSATGRLAVLKDETGEFYLVEKATPEQEAQSELTTVWENGNWVNQKSFAEVRETLRTETARVFS